MAALTHIRSLEFQQLDVVALDPLLAVVASVVLVRVKPASVTVKIANVQSLYAWAVVYFLKNMERSSGFVGFVIGGQEGEKLVV